MKDNIYDLFDISETEVQLFEVAARVDYFYRVPDEVTLEDKRYLKIYLRANNE